MANRNAVKHAARTGERIRGVHLTFAAPTVIEVLGSQLDFVYLDGEHGCFDSRDLEAACIAAELHGLTTIARVPDRSSATITRFLDRGVRGIIVPHIETVAQAREAVNATYFAPLGERSFGGSRPHFLAIADKPAHMLARNADISLCLMIESRAGLDAVGELAAVEGVDYLSFGMMDLAQSLGHSGNPGHPEVKQAVDAARARINAAGKRVREEFMNFAWINDIVLAGAKALLAS
ncbi:MAG: aldolase/citrate lyase family protein [Acetobacteraceae bacterium]